MVQIRRATPADAPALATFDARRLSEPADTLRPLIEAALTRGRDKVWLAHDADDTLCGYAKAYWVCPTSQSSKAPDSRGVRSGFHLMGLEVAPEHRRMGVGTALTRARLDWCAQQGAPEVFFVVRPDNTGSLALHAALGFEIVGEASYDGRDTSRVGRLALDPPLPLRIRDPLQQTGLAPLALDAVVPLYDAVGWSAYTREPERLMAAIHRSSWVATRWSGDRLVGLCRVVTDDMSIVYLQDILVHPDQQRQGLGRSLARLALDRFDHVRQLVLITDDRPAQRAFYASLGLTDIEGSPLRCFARMPGL